MSAFWVVGGQYRDTRFDRFAAGHGEERHGPFAAYADAEREWHRLSWRFVDDCNVRYRIVEQSMAE